MSLGLAETKAERAAFRIGYKEYATHIREARENGSSRKCISMQKSTLVYNDVQLISDMQILQGQRKDSAGIADQQHRKTELAEPAFAEGTGPLVGGQRACNTADGLSKKEPVSARNCGR